MAVIKNAQSERLTKSALVFDLGDWHRQGEEIVERARHESARILREAQVQASAKVAEVTAKAHEEGLRKGTEEGRRQGLQLGREQAFAEYSAALTQLQGGWSAAIEAWDRDRGRMLLEAREDVLAFAIRLGERVTRRAIDLDPSIVSAQVTDVLGLLSQPGKAQISIHPDDRPIVEAALPEILAASRNSREIEFVNDSTVERGGCRVTTAQGAIDATIARQIDRIATTLLPGRADATENGAEERSGGGAP